MDARVNWQIRPPNNVDIQNSKASVSITKSSAQYMEGKYTNWQKRMKPNSTHRILFFITCEVYFHIVLLLVCVPSNFFPVPPKK